MELYSYDTIKHLKNVMAFARDAKLESLDGRHAVAFAESFQYLVKAIKEIEEHLEQRIRAEDLVNNED